MVWIRVFFNIAIMSWKEFILWVSNFQNRFKPISYYNYNDYSDFACFMYYINTNKSIFNEYLKKFDLNVDFLFFYFYFIYYSAKWNFIIRCGIHTIFYNIYLNNQKSPELKSKSDNLYREYLGVEFSKPTINKKLEKYYHIFKNKLKNTKNIISPNYKILFNSTSIVKNIDGNAEYTLFFLRKNKSFNKGRYSRNRQNYRTGVYWCLYINILALFGLYFYFYRFTFNFGYLWWLFYCLPASFIIPQSIRLKLYNPYVFYNYTVLYLEFLYNCINIIFFKK